METNAPLAYALGTELHRLIMSTLGGHRGSFRDIERHRGYINHQFLKHVDPYFQLLKNGKYWHDFVTSMGHNL